MTLTAPVLLAGTPDPLLTPRSPLLLPPFQIESHPARAHTQGLEILDQHFFVTARWEDTQPRRALLLRTSPGRIDWDAWLLASDDDALNHPGGFQSDGRRLWIPVAESRRGGRTRIGAYPLSGLKPGQPAKPDFEFTVADHIGAIAVSRPRQELIGANWDTETIYIWTFQGRLKRRFDTVAAPGLGVGRTANGGVAVQDWKVWDKQIFASGLVPGIRDHPQATASRLILLPIQLRPQDAPRDIPLPAVDRIELSREGMAIADGAAWFLPGDLGASNRLYRVPLPPDLPRSRTKSN